MRKFTYVDVRDWKVADVNGRTLSLTVANEKGERKQVKKFDGFRSASNAAKKLGGYAVRA